MIPIDFPQANRTLGAPEGSSDVTPLRIWTDGRECISCWQLSEADRAKILAGEPIYLRILSGATMFPAWIEAGSPFEDSRYNEVDAAILVKAGIAP